MGKRVWWRFSRHIPDGQFLRSQWKNRKTRKRAAFDDDLNLHSSFILSGQNFPSSLAVCLFVGVCLSISEPQCWAGPGHRGFCNGVGGLCFAAQSSKSCLSVLSSWTSCNNTNGPLNMLLCCAALAQVTSHTRTLARSETHTYDGAEIHTKSICSHVSKRRRMFGHVCKHGCTR